MAEKFNKLSLWFYLLLVVCFLYTSYKLFSQQSTINLRLDTKPSYHYVDSSDIVIKDAIISKADTIIKKLDYIEKLSKKQW